MPILLATDAEVCARTLVASPVDGIVVLASQGESALDAPLRAAIPDLVVAEVGSQRLARLNFDFVRAFVLDLPEDTLLSSPGRRLVESLGRLADESLLLAFIGSSVSAAGGFLFDGVHAGLGLIPHTVVVPSLSAVADLRGLLATLSASGTRLVALDAPVAVTYEAASDAVAVAGTGSALLASFASGAGDAPTARLHVLNGGMSARWPE